MGKWSQYRLRGTVRLVPPPVPELLYELAASGGDSGVPFGQLSSNVYVAGRPVISLVASRTITSVQLHMKYLGGVPGFTMQAVIWGQVTAAPALPRLATSGSLPGSTLGAADAWIEFTFASPPTIAGGTPFYVGLVASGTSAGFGYWHTGGGALSGISFSGSADPPTTANSGSVAPWLRVYGY